MLSMLLTWVIFSNCIAKIRDNRFLPYRRIALAIEIVDPMRGSKLCCRGTRITPTCVGLRPACSRRYASNS